MDKETITTPEKYKVTQGGLQGEVVDALNPILAMRTRIMNIIDREGFSTEEKARLIQIEEGTLR